MELLDLYKEENKDILYSISWLNKNSIFDKSIGAFRDIDLFTFLENIEKYNYKKDIFYDDIYYILEYTEETILYLIRNINKEIKREHNVVPISQAKEFDSKSVLWISRQNGRTIKEKLSNGKIKAVQRYYNIDTYENRIFKKFLKKLFEVYEIRSDLKKFDNLFLKIRKWLRSEESRSIDEYKTIVYNNLLLHHQHYNKIFKSYKWINNLNKELTLHKDKYPLQILLILTFDLLSKLHFKTNKLILPYDLEIKHAEFDLCFNNKWLLENFELENKIKNLKIKSLDEVCFSNIVNLRNDVLNNQLNIDLIDKTSFFIKNTEKDVFVDLFRLFPIAKRENEIIKFPITLKQKVNNKIVNANNTKIINLDNSIYTLPEVLNNYDTDTLRYFLEDFKNYFNGSKLNYIIPDYVNVFEFTQSKRMINSYFKYNKPIPKSILGGLEYIFNKKITKNDTLISIQKNHHNEFYITPLLVRYDKKLEEITNGLYLERYPTKKLKNVDNNILESLNKVFDKETSQILLNKFLQNGLKGIKKENIVFYKNDKVFDLIEFEIPKNKHLNQDKIRKLYNTPNLFNNDVHEIDDDNEENLVNFQLLLKYELNGFKLWREHLPDLSMEIVVDGYYKDFILVDEKSELINNTLEINNGFLIPKGVSELSFPLKFGDEKINYKAYLSSKDFPYNQDIECKLSLTYDYERENPYELIFEPFDKEFKNIHVVWKKQTFEDIVLPIPNYPERKSWKDLEIFTKRNGEKENLLNWLAKDLYKIIKIDSYNLMQNREKSILSNNWEIDVNSKKFQEIETSKGFVRIYYNNYLENVKGISFNLEQNGRYFKVVNILTDQEHFKLMKSYRFPLLTIFNNGNHLTDIEVPNKFRELIHKATESALSIYIHTDNNKLKDEMFYFLCCLNSNTPKDIGIKLSEYSSEYISFEKYLDNVAYSIGYLTLEWQQKIFENTIKFLNSTKENEYSDALKVLGIVVWRYDMFILRISKDIIETIVKKLYESLKHKVNEIIYFKSKAGNLMIKKSLLIRLELLLALIRYREKDKNFLSPAEELTRNYIKIINNLVEIIEINNIEFVSKIELDLRKPISFFKTPDLLYALNVYLRADNGAANSIKVLGVSDD